MNTQLWWEFLSRQRFSSAYCSVQNGTVQSLNGKRKAFARVMFQFFVLWSRESET